MTSTVAGHFKRRVARRLFLFLLLVPLAPILSIWAVATVALVSGCRVDQTTQCVVAWFSVNEIIEATLRVAAASVVELVERSDRWLLAYNLATGLWLVACLLASVRGWLDTLSRTLLGLLATIVCAFAPYFGPILAIGLLSRGWHCEPNAGGVGDCRIFGGAVDSAHAAVRLAEPTLSFGGIILCGVLFLGYAIAIVSVRLLSRDTA